MRFGFTTGTCAAAGSKAAAYMLLTGKTKSSIKILTPKGMEFNAEIKNICITETSVSCAVIKDGGDDPDITTGAEIVSTVSLMSPEEFEIFKTELQDKEISVAVKIEGGEGVGKVTKPGLDQKVGEAAINSVPREMIKKEILEVCNLLDYKGGIKAVISVPEGKNLSAKTFNPRLGIVDGISILGTSGVVEPMSSQALLDTIKVELKQNYELGNRTIVISPGEYGKHFLKDLYDYDLDKSVKCSNFIGQTIDMAVELKFEKMLLCGHIGKLIKVAGGIMNTHSKEADCRMEILSAAAIQSGCDLKTATTILNQCVTTEDAVSILKTTSYFEKTMEILTEKIMFYLNKRAMNQIKIECMFFCNQFGILGKTENAESVLKECKNQFNGEI